MKKLKQRVRFVVIHGALIALLYATMRYHLPSLGRAVMLVSSLLAVLMDVTCFLVCVIHITKKFNDEAKQGLIEHERYLPASATFLTDVLISGMFAALGWTGMLVGALWFTTQIAEFIFYHVIDELKKEKKSKDKVFIHPDIMKGC